MAGSNTDVFLSRVRKAKADADAAGRLSRGSLLISIRMPVDTKTQFDFLQQETNREFGQIIKDYIIDKIRTAYEAMQAAG